MPIRAQVGSGDGVTNASITPLTSSTPTSPIATEIASRPAAASAWRARQRPGRPTPSRCRSPAPAATKTAVSSRIPCGVISPKNTSARPLPIIIPPTRPTLTAFCSSTRPRADQRDPEDQRAAGHQRVVRPDLEGEGLRRVLRVVRRRSRCSTSCLICVRGGDPVPQLRVRGDPAHERERTAENAVADAAPPRPRPVHGHREVDRDEPAHLRPGRRRPAGDRAAAPGDQRGQPADQRRVGRAVWTTDRCVAVRW